MNVRSLIPTLALLASVAAGPAQSAETPKSSAIIAAPKVEPVKKEPAGASTESKKAKGSPASAPKAAKPDKGEINLREPGPGAQKRITALIQDIYGQTVKIKRFFVADSDLIGIVLTEGTGRDLLHYAPRDGKTLIIGSLIRGDGASSTAQVAKQLGVAAPLLDPQFPSGDLKVDLAKAKAVSELPAIRQGSGPKNLYIMADPFCGYCRKAHQAFIDNPELGKQYTAHWILTSMIGGAAADQAIGDLLEGRANLAEIFSREYPKTEAPAVINPESIAQINRAREVFMAATTSTGVPAVFTLSEDSARLRNGFNPASYLQPTVVSTQP